MRVGHYFIKSTENGFSGWEREREGEWETEIGGNKRKALQKGTKETYNNP